jgi:hypothetical protein
MGQRVAPDRGVRLLAATGVLAAVLLGFGGQQALAADETCAPTDIVPNQLPRKDGGPAQSCGQTSHPSTQGGVAAEATDVPPNPLPPTPWKDGSDAGAATETLTPEATPTARPGRQVATANTKLAKNAAQSRKAEKAAKPKSKGVREAKKSCAR